MRYIINDDDFEDWVDLLKGVLSEIRKDYPLTSLEYVIGEMESELSQHKKEQP